MFENCITLFELNAERGKLVSSGEDVTTINNAYNERRQEILTQRKPFTVLNAIKVEPLPIQKYMGIPVAGKSPKAGVITLTEAGFLY